jgi:ferritin
MKMSEDLCAALNQQTIHELRNQNTYLQIASYFENLELKNLAKFFFEQASGEKEHAQLFINHLNDRIGGQVQIGTIPAPVMGLLSPESAGLLYLQVETSTTEAIEDIMDLVLESKSYIDQPFISKMLDEQVEEEDSANHFNLLISKVKDIVLFDATFGA